ncbi:hypothetical protein [Ferrovum myxofaciens]|uniref:hypothetical protein n=1 Tax=Ferrovum myxofaciens TaxID=416213 RepID=UPI002356341A|nr:hypothetical protein [Ferrovum myxofaciens]MBU6995406.1 hypothetical protein [Ferrovum myxofaciens]
MTKIKSNRYRYRYRYRKTKLVFLGTSFLILMGVGGVFMEYRASGYSVAEILNYLDRRVEGHPRLEKWTAPVFARIRALEGSSEFQAQAAQPFLIPPPPPRWGMVPLKGGEEQALIEPYLSGVWLVPPGPVHRILHVGPSESIKSISVAASMARDGDVVQIDAGDYHEDVVASWGQNDLLIQGVGGNARLFAEGNSAEGKAIWVVRGGRIRIENIDFMNAQVSDRNGAGIRFEKGDLWVRNCLFFANENGLLTSDEENSSLVIENSEFAYNGAGDGFSHDLYVGKLKSLVVLASYFHHANVGHLFKSRAARNDILYNRLTDEMGGRASYELDLPNGGTALVLGNIIQQGTDTENSTVIAYGEEGMSWPDNALYLASNTLVNDKEGAGAFLRVPKAGARVVSVNNLLVGYGEYHVLAGLVSSNDRSVDWQAFYRPLRQDYRLEAPVEEQLHYETPSPSLAPDIDLVPRAEPVAPRQLNLLKHGPVYPGALQTLAP